jgi:hypothetical protein
MHNLRALPQGNPASRTKYVCTFEPITSEQATKWAAAAHIGRASKADDGTPRKNSSVRDRADNALSSGRDK